MRQPIKPVIDRSDVGAGALEFVHAFGGTVPMVFTAVPAAVVPFPTVVVAFRIIFRARTLLAAGVMLLAFLAAGPRLARAIVSVASRARIVLALIAIRLGLVAVRRLLVAIGRSGVAGLTAIGAVAIVIVRIFVARRMALAAAAAGLFARRRVAVVGRLARVVVYFTVGFDDVVEPLADRNAGLARSLARSLAGLRAEQAFDIPRTARFHARAQSHIGRSWICPVWSRRSLTGDAGGRSPGSSAATFSGLG